MTESDIIRSRPRFKARIETVNGGSHSPTILPRLLTPGVSLVMFLTIIPELNGIRLQLSTHFKDNKEPWNAAVNRFYIAPLQTRFKIYLDAYLIYHDF